MAYNFQVTVDCGDPHRLADWWAETLDWIVEPTDEAFIKEMLQRGYASPADTTTYNGSLVWADGAAIRHPDEETEPAPRRRVLFQRVPERKTVKNRLHLDVRVGADEVAATRERLVARGATHLHDGRQGPHTWITMADPEGNEFCIS